MMTRKVNKCIQTRDLGGRRDASNRQGELVFRHRIDVILARVCIGYPGHARARVVGLLGCTAYHSRSRLSRSRQSTVIVHADVSSPEPSSRQRIPSLNVGDNRRRIQLRSCLQNESSTRCDGKPCRRRLSALVGHLERAKGFPPFPSSHVHGTKIMPGKPQRSQLYRPLECCVAHQPKTCEGQVLLRRQLSSPLHGITYLAPPQPLAHYLKVRSRARSALPRQ